MTGTLDGSPVRRPCRRAKDCDAICLEEHVQTSADDVGQGHAFCFCKLVNYVMDLDLHLDAESAKPSGLGTHLRSGSRPSAGPPRITSGEHLGQLFTEGAQMQRQMGQRQPVGHFAWIRPEAGLGGYGPIILPILS